MTQDEIANFLHPIPTFAIVDPKGVPYMVVGEDAKVTGYFFTSFREAQRILKVATSSADTAIAKGDSSSSGSIAANPWKNARISSVPLDVAITLVTRSGLSRGGGNYFRLAPAEEDIDDALAITGQEDLAEGKVPLFYYTDFDIQGDDGRKRSPLYFRKSELEQEFQRLYPGASIPEVQVTELVAVLTELVKTGDEDLKKLKLVAPRESEKKKRDCDRSKEPPFVVGQRIIVL